MQKNGIFYRVVGKIFYGSEKYRFFTEHSAQNMSF